MKYKIYWSEDFGCWLVSHPTNKQGDYWVAYTGLFLHWKDAWDSVFKPTLYSNITCKDLTRLDSDLGNEISCI